MANEWEERRSGRESTTVREAQHGDTNGVALVNPLPLQAILGVVAGVRAKRCTGRKVRLRKSPMRVGTLCVITNLLL